MIGKVDLVSRLQLMQQFGAGRVHMAVVDGQVPQTPFSQLLSVVPLHSNICIFMHSLHPSSQSKFVL